MEFRILGNLEAEADGRVLPLGGSSVQRLLAILLLDANRVVPLSRLAEGLWDENTPDTAVKQARNAVGRLRRLLLAGGVPDAIVTERTGYRIRVAATALDAGLFEARVAQAGRAASDGQLAVAAEVLRSALALWRGPFLAGMTGRVIESAATAWNERRYLVSEMYYDHQLALGRHREIAAELSEFAGDYPLREKPAGQLMIALYRCGRQADALALYDRTRRLLAEEMGIDPGPELRRLHQRILRSDATLTARPQIQDERRSPASHAPYVVPCQLPGAVRHFAGRREELGALARLLDQAGDTAAAVVISAINGMAGIGKTALALYWAHRVADRFPDGQLYVNLRGYDPSGAPMAAGEAIRGFLDALQVPSANIPASLIAQVGLYRSLLAGKRMLIVLDNARDAAQVRPLFPGSSSCLVLVTSRSQLAGLAATEGAHQIHLDVLTEAEAYDLLARRLGAERMACEPEAVRRFMAQAAGLPLALGITAALAAARPGFPLSALAAQLEEARGSLDVLDAGDLASNVRAVFSWSYQHLDAQTARMFRLLSVHAGPDISVPAAASLTDLPLAQACRALSDLTEANLLAEHSPGRFAFHDLLRAYAAEQARNHDHQADLRAALHRVLDHYLHSALAAERLLDPARQSFLRDIAAPRPGAQPERFAGTAQALAWFEAERAVLLAAALAADSELGGYAWQLPWVLTAYIVRQGRRQDWAAVQRTALASVERIKDRAVQARVLVGLGRASTHLGATAQALSQLSQACRVFGQLGDPVTEARCHNDIGRLYEKESRYREALDSAESALRLFRTTTYRQGVAGSLNNTGWYHSLLGNHQEGLLRCQEALGLFRELGDRSGEAVALASLGYIYHHLGQPAETAACFQRALELFQQNGDYHNKAETLITLGDIKKDAGELAAAREAWQEAFAILHSLDASEADDVRARLRQLVSTSRHRDRATGTVTKTGSSPSGALGA